MNKKSILVEFEGEPEGFYERLNFLKSEFTNLNLNFRNIPSESSSLNKPELSMARRKFNQLSRREQQVFSGIVDGKSNVEIARNLSISDKTVSSYKARLCEKLNLENGAEIVKYAVTNNLVNLSNF